MKKNAVPELDAAWWKKNQAAGLPSAKELEKALEAHAKAWKTLKDHESAEALADSLKALDDVETVAKKVRAEATKVVKNPPKGSFDAADMGHTGDALDGYKAVIEAARKTAKGMVDIDDSLLGQADRYEAYLKGAMTRLKTGPMMFAFGAGGTPVTLRLMMHRSTPGSSLANKLRDFGLKKLTYGVATPDPARPTTILLTLDHAPLQGLAAKFKRIRKLFGPLPFDRMVVMVGGVEQPDEVDPLDPVDDDAVAAAVAPPVAQSSAQPGPAPTPEAKSAAPSSPASPAPDAFEPMKAEMKALMPAVTRQIEAQPASRAALLGLVQDFKTLVAHGQADAARQALAAITARLAPSPGATPPRDASGPAAAMAQWHAARGHALEQLHKLGAAIVAARDPDARDAVQRLQALGQSLPADPPWPQGLTELERFVEGSEDLSDLESPNPFGLDLGLRAPLLQALAGFRAAESSSARTA